MDLELIFENPEKNFVQKFEEPEYYYAATRVRAMIAKLLKEEDYAKLMKMDIYEMLRFLEEGDYKKEIDVIGAKASKIENLERVLNENFANSIHRILLFLPEKCPLKTYIMKYDIFNIKTIIRSKETAGVRSNIEHILIPAGSFNRDYLKSLVSKETNEGVIKALERTCYSKILKTLGSKKNLREVEDILEKFYFKKSLEAAVANEPLLNIIKTEIDIKNILTLLRLKKAQIKDAKQFLIGGGEITIEKLNELSKLEEIEILNYFSKKKFWKYVPKNVKALDKIEAGLRKYLFFKGKELIKDFTPSVKPLLGYIFAKEMEINNIRIFARSKITKNPEDALNIRSKLYLKQI